MMGGVAIEMRVVLIEFGVVFIGGWGYLTLVYKLQFFYIYMYLTVNDLQLL